MGLPALAGQKLAQIGLWALPYLIVFAVGFVAAQAYERKAPWGLKAQRDDALVELGDVRQARDDWKKNRDGWKDYATKVLEPEIVACRDAAGTRVETDSAARETASSRAFDNGFAAGRAAGRRSCGATDATPDPAGLSGAGGVQHDGETLAGRWSQRAYQPPGDLRPDR